MKPALSILFILLIVTCFAQITTDELVVSKFNNIPEEPTIVCFENGEKINNKGGHLQGVQLFQKDKEQYAILSGSSDLYAYLSVVKLGDRNEVISVNRLMEKPFKHAGGIQIFENYLVVGIEDNEKKDKSKVCMYDISEPKNQLLKPFQLIERTGIPKRSTAGCVGITKYKNQALLVVGDWDTKNIDFYSTPFNNIEKDEFKKTQSVNIEKITKKDWKDKNWYSYQNINLFTIQDNLYLIGLGLNKKQQNIADLFRLEENENKKFSLVKLASKKFVGNNEVSFKAGAGVFMNKKGSFNIVSCGYNIETKSYLNYFGDPELNGGKYK